MRMGLGMVKTWTVRRDGETNLRLLYE
jgi:hypothetical protein